MSATASPIDEREAQRIREGFDLLDGVIRGIEQAFQIGDREFGGLRLQRTSSDSCTEFRVKVQRLPRSSSYAAKQCGQQFFGAAEE